MGDSKKRCEKCNKPIDDGKLCTICQYNDFEPKRAFTREEMKLGHERAKDMCKDIIDTVNKNHQW